MARTATIQQVRDRWAELIGLDSTNVITADAAAFLEYVNRNIRKAWQKAEWPFVTKRLAFITDSDLFVDLSSNTEISEVLRVFNADPYVVRDTSGLNHIPVRDDVKDGVYVPQAASPVVLSVTTLVSTGTAATATTSTAHNLINGDTVEIAGANESDYNGKFIVTVTSTTIFTYTMLADPVDTATGTIIATKATVFLFARIRETVYTLLTETTPFELQDFLAHACAADWLRAEGQNGKAELEQANSEAILLDEIDRVERQQKHQPPTEIGVRVTGRN